MIDLRSDTVSAPTDGMRAAMMRATVGDDVYGDDPSVSALEDLTAGLLGHEAGLFCVTGSLANVIGVRAHVRPGQEVLCDAQAHIARAEMGAHGAISGITMRTWRSDRGVADPAAIEELLAPDAGPYLVSTAAVALENTHNFGGGTIQPLVHLRQVHDLCRRKKVALHLDGARLWNAHIATGVPLADYGRLFDTVSVCFSKGLGAPVGSLLAGSSGLIAEARVRRKRLGAGWRQAGLLAAGAAYAMEHQLERLADDHRAARELAYAVAERAPGAVDPRGVETNVVVIDTGAHDPQGIAAAALAAGVAVSALGARMVRAVTHLDVSLEQCRRAGALLGELLSAGGRPDR